MSDSGPFEVSGETVRAGERLARERDRLKLLLDINNAIASHLALDELLHAISESLKRVVPHDISGIGLYDPESGQLRAHVTEYPGDLPNFARGTPIPMEGTTGGEAFTTGQPVFVNQPDLERFNSDYARKTFEAGFKSGGSIPLIAHGRKLGVLGVASMRENAFTEKDIELLCQVGNQIAIAVENSLNYEKARGAERELARSLDRLHLLLDVTNSVTSHLDLRQLFKATSDCLRKVIKCDGIGVTIHDPESGMLRVHALEPNYALPVEEGTLVPIEATPAGLAFKSLETVIITKDYLESSTSPYVRRAFANGIRSGCVAPLISHGRALGTLGVVSFQENAFTKEETELITQIAGQIAIAVENALNFESARRAERQVALDRDRFRLLLEINNAIVSHLDLHDLLKAISSSLQEVIQHDMAGISLYEGKDNCLRMYAYSADFPETADLMEGVRVPVEGSPIGIVYSSGRPLVTDRPDPERFPSGFAQRLGEKGAKSGCGIPLISHGRKLGVLSVGSFKESAFAEQDLELLTQIAGQVAVAVENAINFEAVRSAEQQMARERERLELLLEINNKIASSLDLRELFKDISGCLRTLIHHDYADLLFYDAETDQIKLYAVDRSANIQFGEEDVWGPAEGTPPGLAIRLRQTIVRQRPDFTEFPSESLKRAVDEGIRSGCTVPLISRDRVLGVLNIASRREAAFTADDGELMTEVGVQVALAVENALNFEAVRAAEAQMARDRDRLRLLLNVANAIVSLLDLRELITVISSHLSDTIQHDLMGLSVYDPEINQLRTYTYNFSDNKPFIEDGYPIPLEGSFTGRTFTTGEPFFMNLDLERFDNDFTRRFREAGFKSGACVPLVAHGRKLGTLGIASFHEHDFTEDEKEMFCQVANQVAIAVENVLAYREIEALKNKLSEEKLYLEEEINTAYDFEQIIGSSPALKRILKQVATVAPTDSTVLIQGETGTGKEMIARAIHSLSARRERTLVKINCAAIPMGLIESELFGHEKGAFTGAIAQRIGRFELANKGTLFLDEVGEIPQELQPKLLRVLQEREFERLGSTRTIRVDVRLIAATNRDLYRMVGERQFRDDLYYRLNVFPITIPPLRERRDDIPLLVRFFASKFARHMKKHIEAIPADAVAAMQEYNWPGNIRELENFIERAVILTQGTDLQIPFSEMKLPVKAASSPDTTFKATISEDAADLSSLESVEREHISRVLRETDWVVGGPNGAAARLGLKRTTLQARMKKLGISRHRAAP